MNALVGSVPTHTMTIVDDDDLPAVSFYTPNQIVSEEIGLFSTAIALSEVSGKTITVPYSISGTTVPADYIIHDPSPLTIPAGSSTVEINMSILEGDGWEVDETLILTLEPPVNAVVGSPSVQTIVITEQSDEPSVYFESSGQIVGEGNQQFNVMVQMSNAWSEEVIIPFTLTGTAENGPTKDYSITTSPLVVPVGWTQGEIQVQIVDDCIDENDESLVITMGEITNGYQGSPSVHTVQIIDNDSPPEVNFATLYSAVAEDGGTRSIMVNLSIPSVHEVSIPLSLSGSAAQGADYSISTTLLVIPAGSSSGAFEITLVDDPN